MTNKKILTLISLLLVLFLLVGCFPKLNLPPEITSIPVTTAKVGVAYTYNVVATDPNAGDVLTYSLTAEPSGMLIDATNGVITWTPTAAGDFPVTVEVSDEGGLSDTQSFTIIVIAVELELIGIEVVPEAMTLIAGESKTITSVTAHYNDGSEDSIALGDCTYASGATVVATVSNGVVTAVAKGTAIITVTYADMTDTLEVIVSAVELDRIVVLPEEMTLCVPEGLDIGTFQVTAHYNDDSTAVVTSGCVYGISDTTIAEVEAGKVTALKVGLATISISYTEGVITKGTTLNVIVEGTVTIRWLEDAVRFNPDNSFHSAWKNDPIPPDQNPPATLILTGGEYHFVDVQEYYNIYAPPIVEGSVVIDGTGQLFGDTTYTSTVSFLPIKEHFEGEVVIVIYGEEKVVIDHDGTMVGTYTQWSYAYAESDDEVAMSALETCYLEAVLAPEQGPSWWFIGHTEYIAHGGVIPPG